MGPESRFTEVSSLENGYKEAESKGTDDQGPGAEGGEGLR